VGYFFRKLYILLFVVSVFSVPTAVFSQDNPEQDRKSVIKEIVVKNNKIISEATITSKIKMKPGDQFNQDVLNEDLKRLYALGYFTDAVIDIDETPDGIIVSIYVEEKPVVEAINFKGNAKLSTKKLQKGIQSKVGDMLDYSKLAGDINEMKNLYSAEGFQNVNIDYQVEMNNDTKNAIVNIVIDEKERYKIRGVTVDGNTVVKSKDILGMMATRPAWFFIYKGFYDELVFEADMDKIKAYYQDKGYLDVDVTYDFSYDEKQEAMFIKLHINEGTKYVVGNVSVEGDLVFAKEDVMKKISMKPNDAFSHMKLGADMENIRELYFQKGYMNVNVNLDRKLDPTTNKIDLLYTIQANQVVYVGKIDVKGNTKTKDVVVRRELRIYPTEKFDGEKLRRSKERLYNLGFFEDVYFDTIPTEDPAVRDLVVQVKETKTGEFAFGGGYSSVDKLIGFVQLTQRNFDLFNFPYFTGDGQDLSIRASIGMVRMDYDLSWTEPWIFDYPLSFGVDLFNRTHSRASDVGYGFKEIRTGGDLRLGKEFYEYLRGDLMYKLERVTISDLADDATQDLVNERGTNDISSMTVGMTFDTRDNVFAPKTGILAQAMFENAGGFLGFDKSFIKTYFLLGYYYTFFDKFTLELKGRTGIANAYGDTDDVPIYERFYAGGADSIRGYGERRVGPRDQGSNTPIGGEGTMLGNAEVTFPLYEKIIKGAVFFDCGNVWRYVEDYFTLKDGFKMGTGVGVRVKTPLGPIKLDLGYPLSDNHDDKKSVEWYFSMSRDF